MKQSVESARATIHGDLDRWYGEEYDNLKELLDDLLRAHAHELAEKIRAEYPHDYGAGVVANFIDPGAQR